MNRFFGFFAATIIAVGLAALGYFVGDGLRNMRTTERLVTVRGLAEREVQADTARLVIKLVGTGATPTEIFPTLTKTQSDVISFLKELGLKEDEITVGQWQTTRTDSGDLQRDPELPKYSVGGSISVLTRNVGAVEKARKRANDLRIATQGNVTDTSISYDFTGIAAIRAEMIAAATKDARNAALQFATDSGSRVGAINNATQGVFQIVAAGSERDNDEATRKMVRVVTSVQYTLKD